MNRTLTRCVTVAALASACPAATAAPPPIGRPVATYSIVARDPQTGEIGVAVQSHWFGVGSVVCWAEAGTGAVATQSFVDPAYGPLGLDLMRAGRSAYESMRALLVADRGAQYRQVAAVDARGGVFAFTGHQCIAAAGQVVDEEHQFSVQANLMTDDGVWPAMAVAYVETPGDLADRLVAALEAAQAAGGDVRGRQSAALLVVAPAATGRQWDDRLFDLRVEDHPEPVAELKRLVRLRRAYRHMNAGDAAVEASDFEGAAREYAAAEALAPEIVEVAFWRAVTLVSSGRVDEALPVFKRVFAAEPVWVGVIERLVAVKMLPDDREIVDRILAQAPP